jgi:hypothetical protein
LGEFDTLALARTILPNGVPPPHLTFALDQILSAFSGEVE